MGSQNNHSKPIIVEVSEKLEGVQLVFRLKKGGKTVNFGTLKSYESTKDGVLLKFDPDKPGVGKLVCRKDRKEG